MYDSDCEVCQWLEEKATKAEWRVKQAMGMKVGAIKGEELELALKELDLAWDVQDEHERRAHDRDIS